MCAGSAGCSRGKGGCTGKGARGDAGGLRVSLSAKLNESQAVCKALAQEVAAYKAKIAAYER